ncbi:MAG: D-alanyl-D-alanine carboxypeptidase family protein [Alphaproteobacteria bacterium]|nr:D-alanyl-D-alanine carboxypeptidase family protein [Alphaproteobacteria bacterium]
MPPLLPFETRQPTKILVNYLHGQGNLTMYDQIIRGIHVRESENPPILIDMEQDGDFFFCKQFTSEFQLRREVCDRIKAAQKRLPSNYRFMLYEAFRPRARQIELWDAILIQLRNEHPSWNEDQYIVEADKFVANPHGFGSGHQAAAAVDITLCSDSGQEYDMGTKVQEFNPKTLTASNAIKPEEAERRAIMRQALEAQGIVNYPDEWWHFSYGDRLWAEITGRERAFYAPVD